MTIDNDLKLPKDWINQLIKVSGLESLERPIAHIKKEILNKKNISPNQKDIFKGSSDIKILGKIVKIGNKKVFNAIVKKDLISEILKLHDLEEVI